MPDGWIDPGILEGGELTRWYLRSSAEVEREREAGAAKRHKEFFYGPSGAGSDPGFADEPPATYRATDRGFVAPHPSTSRYVDPGFSWVRAGQNRWHGERIAADARSAFTPTLQPVAQPVGELSGPPAVTYGAAQPPATRAVSRARAYGRPVRSPATPVRASTAPPNQRPATAAAPGAGQPISYGALRAPAPSDQELAELRRQQAAFGATTRKIDLGNSWLAIPALGPVATVLGLEGVAAIAGRALTAEGIEEPLDFVGREAWQGGARKAAQALGTAEKNALRVAARTKFARANGISAREMEAEVHHSDPLEWAHLKPDADPNRLANLWGLRGEAHDIATRAWADFSKGLKGRVPTQAELMEAKLRIDRMVEPFLRRAGVPRSNTPPREGGPI